MTSPFPPPALSLQNRRVLAFVLVLVSALACTTRRGGSRDKDDISDAADAADSADASDGADATDATDTADAGDGIAPDTTDGSDPDVTAPDTDGPVDGIDLPDTIALDTAEPDAVLIDVGIDIGPTDTGPGDIGPGDAGPIDPCLDGLIDTTIYAVGKGEYAETTRVRLKNVLAASPKLLVNRSSSTGSCLWGAFVSARLEDGSASPLTETAPYSGLLVVAFGTPATGDGPCPTGTDPFPDTLAPGDEITVVGKVQTFLLNNCQNEPDPPAVGMLQLSEVCEVSASGAKHSLAQPAVLTDEANYLSAPSGDLAYGVHTRWRSVRIAVQGLAADTSSGGVVGPFGTITLQPGSIAVVDKFYYQKGSADICHTAPVYSAASQTFNRIEGFHYLNFCEWGVAPLDKCQDYVPSSDDCQTAEITSCSP